MNIGLLGHCQVGTDGVYAWICLWISRQSVSNRLVSCFLGEKEYLARMEVEFLICEERSLLVFLVTRVLCKTKGKQQ